MSLSSKFQEAKTRLCDFAGHRQAAKVGAVFASLPLTAAAGLAIEPAAAPLFMLMGGLFAGMGAVSFYDKNHRQSEAPKPLQP